MKLALFVTSTLTALSFFAVDAQNTDAAAQIQNLLSTHAPVPYTHQIPHTVNQTTCHSTPCHAPTGDMCAPYPLCTTNPVTTYTPRTDQVVPTASNIRVVSAAPITFEPLLTTSLPDQLTVSDQEFVNCANTPSVQSISLSVAFNKSTSLALNKSVTNTNTYSLNFDWSPVQSLKLGGSATIGTSQTNGTVNTTGIQTTTTRQASSQVTLTKGQAVVAQIEVYPVTMSQVFHTTVTVDADLSPNDQFAHLSDMYSDPTSRTFPVSGSISITDASEGKTETFEAPDEPNICAGQTTGIMQVKYTPSSTKPLMLREPTVEERLIKAIRRHKQKTDSQSASSTR